MTRKFTHLNEAFVCENCGRSVPAASTGCRNHCPFCLHSKHVDIFPGDRQETCNGLMKPIGYEINGKKGIVLLFKCCRCGIENKNIASLNDKNQADDYDEILKIGTTPKL